MTREAADGRARPGARALAGVVLAGVGLSGALVAHAADLRSLYQAPATEAAASRAVAEASGAAAQAGTGTLAGASVGSAVPALGFGAVLQTALGLALVLGVVFGCAWLARRLGVQGVRRNALVKTIGGASLGGKERVAVVEIGDTWLVLGAAPGNVRLLHTLPAGAVPVAASDAAASSTSAPSPPFSAPQQGSFAQRFRDALKSEAGKRFRRHDGGAQ